MFKIFAIVQARREDLYFTSLGALLLTTHPLQQEMGLARKLDLLKDIITAHVNQSARWTRGITEIPNRHYSPLIRDEGQADSIAPCNER